MSSVLVLGGCGEMGSAAVADLVERTGHEVTIGDVRPAAAAELLRRLGAPERVVRVDVDDPASLATALDGAEVVLNATYMRHNVPVTDAAIAAGAHLVDLGSSATARPARGRPGTVAAIAADLVARGGAAGVHPPEAAFDPQRFLDALADRELAVSERELR